MRINPGLLTPEAVRQLAELDTRVRRLETTAVAGGSAQVMALADGRRLTVPITRLKVRESDENSTVHGAETITFDSEQFVLTDDEALEAFVAIRPHQIWVHNGTGGTVPAGGVYAIAVPLAELSLPIPEPDSAENEAAFAARPTFSGDVPDDSSGDFPPFAVPLEEASSAETVRAIYSGVVIASVDVVSVSHRCARPVAGETGHLESCVVGPARLLYRPLDTGVQTCIVYLTGGPPARHSLRRENSEGTTISEVVYSGTVTLHPASAWGFTQDGPHVDLTASYVTGGNPGIVSLTDQTMGDGTKTFISHVGVQGIFSAIGTSVFTNFGGVTPIDPTTRGLPIKTDAIGWPALGASAASAFLTSFGVYGGSGVDPRGSDFIAFSGGTASSPTWVLAYHDDDDGINGWNYAITFGVSPDGGCEFDVYGNLNVVGDAQDDETAITVTVRGTEDYDGTYTGGTGEVAGLFFACGLYVSGDFEGVTDIVAGTGITTSGTGSVTVGIADAGVDTGQLADGAVTTDKIADGAVTAAKIADGAALKPGDKLRGRQTW